MDTGSDQTGAGTPEIGVPDLVQLCRILNEAEVRYLVYGAMACLLHGHERMSRDVDIYLGDDRDNITRALAALGRWGEGVAAELSVDDVLDSVVVRICDTCVVDVASRVWGLDWDAAWRRRRVVMIGDVKIPFLCRADLIASKETYREQDRWDQRILRGMKGPEPGEPGEKEAAE